MSFLLRFLFKLIFLYSNSLDRDIVFVVHVKVLKIVGGAKLTMKRAREIFTCSHTHHSFINGV